MGGGLWRKVERHLNPELGGAPHERTKVGERAEVGVHGIVPTGCAVGQRPSDCPRRAWLARQHRCAVIASFPIGEPDGVDRWQVDHVESHCRNCVQPPCGGSEGAAFPRAIPALMRSLGAGKKLLPGAHPGGAALNEEGMFGRLVRECCERAEGELEKHGAVDERATVCCLARRQWGGAQLAGNRRQGGSGWQRSGCLGWFPLPQAGAAALKSVL